ncbi:hypothetical protein Glove_132g91 [Diversispora epigaea]|uniref:Uncharacterized protein n=1 Tax=Diversispora epigaea TaxID=1348612 RepID=A0A397J6P2_9GLOM|nr:hypothetical protein Glove_132g91 [Diversispora epigaea]
MPAFPHKLEYNIHQCWPMTNYDLLVNYKCAIRLHHQYEINKGMFCLFTNKKNNPKERFEALREIIKIENNNKNNIESADEVYELLSQEVYCLQKLYAKYTNGCWKDVP